jgi:hypothetical protein
MYLFMDDEVKLTETRVVDLAWREMIAGRQARNAPRPGGRALKILAILGWSKEGSSFSAVG